MATVMTDSPIVSDRLSQALFWCIQYHWKEVRKQGTPYVAHHLAVASLILEAGYHEDVAIAGLLYRSLETDKIKVTQLTLEWSGEIAQWIMENTQRRHLDKVERRALYVKNIAAASPEGQAISAASRLHNLRSYALDGFEAPLDWYQALLPIYEAHPNERVHLWAIEMGALIEVLSQRGHVNPSLN